MNFQLSQEQQDLRDLVAKMFADLVPAETLPDFAIPGDRFDEKLWSELAKASLLGIGIPEAYGGAGMGVIELAILLEESGKRLAPVPLLESLVMGAAAIVRFGSEEQKRALLPGVAAGKRILTAALHDFGAADPLAPTTRARGSAGGWLIEGCKDHVPAAGLASQILVPALDDDDRVGLFLVERDANGLASEPQATTTGELEYRLTFDGITVPNNRRLEATVDGREALSWIMNLTLAGLCATELGIAERALRMTAEYTASRKQFGKPIATFQAVAQRAADAYIDLEALRLATMQAVWRLSTGQPATREVSIAKFWAAEGGHRICYAAQHLHGGIGVDTDYPLHHYYLASRRIELTLGGTHTHLAKLGDLLASAGAPEG